MMPPTARRWLRDLGIKEVVMPLLEQLEEAIVEARAAHVNRLQDIYHEEFQAFSALSDVQDLVAIWATDGVVSLAASDSINDRINHAKGHLLAIINADRDGYGEAMGSMPLTCTLGIVEDPNGRTRQ